MAEHEHQDEHEPLTEEELERENGEPLPDREVMSKIDFSPGPMQGIDPGATLPIEPNPTE